MWNNNFPFFVPFRIFGTTIRCSQLQGSNNDDVPNQTWSIANFWCQQWWLMITMPCHHHRKNSFFNYLFIFFSKVTLVFYPGLEFPMFFSNGLFTWFFAKFLWNFCEIFTNFYKFFAKLLQTDFSQIFCKKCVKISQKFRKNFANILRKTTWRIRNCSLFIIRFFEHYDLECIFFKTWIKLSFNILFVYPVIS